MIKKKLRVCLTNKCNFRCTYCRPGGEGSCNANKDLSPEELLSITKYLYTNYMFSFIRLTGGEPLIRKDLYEIVEMLDSTKCFDKITMVSNGSLINSHEANKISKLNFKSITISLDTLKKDVFKRLTGVDCLDDVCSAIKYLKNNNVNVKINSVVTKSNYNDMFDLISFASNLHVPIKLLDYIVYDERDFDNNYQPMVEIKERLHGKAYKIDIQYQDEGFGIPEEVYYINNTKVIVKDSSLGTCYAPNLCHECAHYPCQSGIVSFVLTNDGVLRLCSNESHTLDLKPLIKHDTDTSVKLKKLISSYEQSHFSRSWDKPNKIKRC